jgi:hypothetical protein
VYQIALTSISCFTTTKLKAEVIFFCAVAILLFYIVRSIVKKRNFFSKVGYHIPFQYLKVNLVLSLLPPCKVAHIHVVSTDHTKLECGMECLLVVSFLYQVSFTSVNWLKSWNEAYLLPDFYLVYYNQLCRLVFF